MRKLLILLIINLVLLILSQQSNALACSTTFVPLLSPTPDPYLIERQTREAEMVVEATVIKADKYSPGSNLYLTVIKIHQYFKGSGSEIVSFLTAGKFCVQDSFAGDRKIFFILLQFASTYGVPLPSDFVGYSFDNYTPDQKNIAEAITAAGHQPVLPNGVTSVPATTPTIFVTPQPNPTSVSIPTVIVTSQPSPTIAQIVSPVQNTNSEVNGLVWFGVGLLVGGGVIWFGLRRRRG